jgi:hypothetical protein
MRGIQGLGFRVRLPQPSDVAHFLDLSRGFIKGMKTLQILGHWDLPSDVAHFLDLSRLDSIPQAVHNLDRRRNTKVARDEGVL